MNRRAFAALIARAAPRNWRAQGDIFRPLSAARARDRRFEAFVCATAAEPAHWNLWLETLGLSEGEIRASLDDVTLVGALPPWAVALGSFLDAAKGPVSADGLRQTAALLVRPMTVNRPFLRPEALADLAATLAARLARTVWRRFDSD
jgi:hypothetical protein